MVNKSDIEKLKSYREGLPGEGEDKYIHSLFAENEHDREFKNHMRNEFYGYLKNNTDENHNLSYLLDRIHHTLHKEEYQKKEILLKKIYRWYTVAAAVLLIPILLAGGIWFVSQKMENGIIAENSVTSTVFAPLGSRINFALPDGTKGWLNSGSSLEYNVPFNNNRQVAIRGEAWFDVAHDADNPFEITAGNSKVKVLGTKFNLSAYPEDKYMEVVLEEGKVEFSTLGLSSEVVMKPNERLVLSGGELIVDITDASKYSAWKEGKLVFRGDSMDEVARRIARWYNVEVELADKELTEFTFRGTFQDDSLEEVLKFLSMTSPINYEILDRKQQADGTVVRKKITLYKKHM